MTDNVQAQEEDKMPLLEHLVELRTRLMYAVGGFFVAFLVCFYFANPMFDFLVEPLAGLWEGEEDRRMIYTALHEKFFTKLKLFS